MIRAAMKWNNYPISLEYITKSIALLWNTVYIKHNAYLVIDQYVKLLKILDNCFRYKHIHLFVVRKKIATNFTRDVDKHYKHWKNNKIPVINQLPNKILIVWFLLLFCFSFFFCLFVLFFGQQIVPYLSIINLEIFSNNLKH